jgi:hypothetical protein
MAKTLQRGVAKDGFARLIGVLLMMVKNPAPAEKQFPVPLFDH